MNVLTFFYFVEIVVNKGSLERFYVYGAGTFGWQITL
jgi:hypothetical protein